MPIGRAEHADVWVDLLSALNPAGGNAYRQG